MLIAPAIPHRKELSPYGSIRHDYYHGLAAHRDVDNTSITMTPLFFFFRAMALPGSHTDLLVFPYVDSSGPVTAVLNPPGVSERSESVCTSEGDCVGCPYIYAPVRINSISDSYIYVRHCLCDYHSSKEGMTTGVNYPICKAQESLIRTKLSCPHHTH